MPWKETSPMLERMSFLREYLRGEESTSAICLSLRHFAQDGLEVDRAL